MSVARKRWKMLGDVLRKKKCRIDGNSPISVRRFTSFGLLKAEVLPSEVSEDGLPKYLQYRYTCPTFPGFTADIRHIHAAMELGDLLGFNNTGNVCVWPSEEILTYYCLQNAYKFRNKSVCELGGGMTCLSGITLALCSEADQVLLTDGNELSVDNVASVIRETSTLFGSTQVKSRLLRWNEPEKLQDIAGTFDYVICADCLFFDEYRQNLVDTMHTLLKPQGEAIIFAPSRGDTFKEFASISALKFRVHKLEKYDAKIWEIHQQKKTMGLEVYDENLHYPLFMQLFKDTQESCDNSVQIN